MFVPSSSMLALLAVGTAVVSTFILLQRRRPIVQGGRLPPGPIALPLVGNILSVDAKKPWITYTKWANRYGDIFMIRVLNEDIIVVSSQKIAKELLERRSGIYSDRPYFATREPYGFSFNFAFTPYGNRWRLQRRIFHQAFRADAALSFRPVQLRKARQLVLDILNTPPDFFTHIRRFAASVIMMIVYDYEVAPNHDHFVELFERGMSLAMEGLTPETAAIVRAFPFVLDLPEWFPGSAFSRKATVSKYCAKQMITEPFEYARKREATGSDRPAVALDLLRHTKDVDDPVQLQLLKDTCATAFVAATETTMSTVQCFVLAITQHPEVQERAHAEIDTVVGTKRLPNFDDRLNLPYIEAILMETLRFYTIVPLGVAHANTSDDIYEDIFIPKGSTIVPNVWAMLHNEDVYPDPDLFKPERFLVDGKLCQDKFIDNIAFGFGRRVCPGRYFADASVWAAIVSMLSVFKITKARNEQGEEIEFEPTFSCGVTSNPDPFPCVITPRLSNMDIQCLQRQTFE